MTAFAPADPGSTIRSIEVIEALWRNYGVAVDYEKILEISYRRFLRKGDTVVDVGAHSGTHTVHFLDIVGPEGRVIAFEPLPDVHSALRHRFRDFPNLKTFELALSSSAHVNAEFVRANGSLAESGLKERIFNDPASVAPSRIQVRVDTLDRIYPELALESLAYIKMDIEGAELDAINGASQTIARLRPLISIEYGRQAYAAYGHEEDSLLALTDRLGYAIFDPYFQFIGSRTLWDQAKSRYCWDYFLVPVERAAEARTWSHIPYRSDEAARGRPGMFGRLVGRGRQRMPGQA